MIRKLALALSLALCFAVAPAVAASAAGARPSITAPSAILIEPSSGRIVYARSPYKRRGIASTTKLMTALLLLEKRSMTHRIKAISYNGSAAESTAGLVPGERLSSADMLRALFLASANDAAAAIAVDIGGSRRGFVRMMNARARRAGLTGTHFSNPIGLDGSGNYSTARDLSKLAVLVRRFAVARETMNRSKATLYSGSRRRVVVNRNTLVSSVPWMNGIKTGHTGSAGYLLVGGASRNGVQLISVVMAEPSEAARNADTLKLMRYGFSRYRSVRAVRKGQVFARVDVTGRPEQVALVASRTADVVVARSSSPTTALSGIPSEIEGPLKRGTKVGFVSVRRDGRPVERVPLVTASSVEAPALIATLSGGPWPLIGAFVVFTLIALAANLAWRRRRQGAHVGIKAN
ncbi:MAG: hypothetical protein F2813_04545 [Actinobacteria bacterium]|uniref:serine-type D-Ala-D-Ala carboxypeptidase n=1 Tax=freshwater metagenome TaxID=449393 RepID=A0A6J5ZSK6_9ZZZZ|nr:hypothetical protein [Actinomycetota bacterium]